MIGKLEKVKEDVERYARSLLGEKGRREKHAGFRAIQSAYALNILNSQMGDQAKELALQAIAKSFKENTGFWGLRASRLHGYLTQLKSPKKLILDTKKLALYELGGLLRLHDTTASQSVKALLSVLFNILQSNIPERDKALAIDQWLVTVGMLSQNLDQQFASVVREYPILEKIRATQQRQKSPRGGASIPVTLSSPTVDQLVEPVNPHSTYQEKIAEVNKRMGDMRENIGTYNNYLGFRDDMLFFLNKTESEFRRLPVITSFTPLILRDIEAYGSLVATVQSKVDAYKSEIKTLIDKIGQPVSESKCKSYRAEKAQLGEELEKFAAETEKPIVDGEQRTAVVFGEYAKGNFDKIVNRVEELRQRTETLKQRVERLDKYRELTTSLAVRIAALLEELEARELKEQQLDPESLRPVLVGKLKQLQFNLANLHSHGEFASVYARLADLDWQYSEIAGGVAILQRSAVAAKSCRSLRGEVGMMLRSDEFKGRNSREESLKQLAGKITRIQERLHEHTRHNNRDSGPRPNREFSPALVQELELKYDAVEGELKEIETDKAKISQIDDAASRLHAACNPLIKAWRDFTTYFSSIFSKKEEKGVSKPSLASVPKEVVSKEESQYIRKAQGKKANTLNADHLHALVMRPGGLESRDNLKNYKIYSYCLIRGKINAMKQIANGELTGEDRTAALKSCSDELNKIFDVVGKTLGSTKKGKIFPPLLKQLEDEYAQLCHSAAMESFNQFSEAENSFLETITQNPDYSRKFPKDASGLIGLLETAIKREYSDETSKSLFRLDSYYVLRELTKIMQTNVREIFALANQLKGVGLALEQESLSPLTEKIWELWALIRKFSKLLDVIKSHKSLTSHATHFESMLKQFERELVELEGGPYTQAWQTYEKFSELITDTSFEKLQAAEKLQQVATLNADRAREEIKALTLQEPVLQRVLENVNLENVKDGIEQNADIEVKPTAKLQAEIKQEAKEAKEAQEPKRVLTDEEAYESLKEMGRAAAFDSLQQAIRDLVQNLYAPPKVINKNLSEVTQKMVKRCLDNNAKFVISPKAFVYLNSDEIKAKLDKSLHGFDVSCTREIVDCGNARASILREASKMTKEFFNGLKDETIHRLILAILQSSFPGKLTVKEQRLMEEIKGIHRSRSDLLIRDNETARDLAGIIGAIGEELHLNTGDRLFEERRKLQKNTVLVLCRKILAFPQVNGVPDLENPILLPGVGAAELMRWLNEALTWKDKQASATTKEMQILSKILHKLLEQRVGVPNQIAAAKEKADAFLKENSLDDVTRQLRDALSAILSERESNKRGILKLVEFLRANVSSHAPDQQHQWQKMLDDHNLSTDHMNAQLLMESPGQALDFINRNLSVLRRGNQGRVVEGILKLKIAEFSADHELKSMFKIVSKNSEPLKFQFSSPDSHLVLEEAKGRKSSSLDRLGVDAAPQATPDEESISGKLQVYDETDEIIHQGERVREIEYDALEVHDMSLRIYSLVKSQGTGISGYDLMIMSVDKNQKDMIELVEKASKGKKFPVLVKRGDRYYIYGNSKFNESHGDDAVVVTNIADERKIPVDRMRHLCKESRPILGRNSKGFFLLKFNGERWIASPKLTLTPEIAEKLQPRSSKYYKVEERIDNLNGQQSLALYTVLAKAGCRKHWKLTPLNLPSDLTRGLAFPPVGQEAKLVEGHEVPGPIYEQITAKRGHRAPSIQQMTNNINSAKKETKEANVALDNAERPSLCLAR